MNIGKLQSSIIAFAAIFTLSMTNANAGDFLKCEKRSNPSRSKISVEAEDLTPGAIYSATVTSGSNSAVASVSANPGGEAEYDFDSNMNDILAGASAISSNFIDDSVTAAVTDAMGNEVASGSASCRVK